MSIPLDRLYNYLDDLNNCDILIYRFFPHGSKKLEDLTLLQPYNHCGPFEFAILPNMICHDQEPLNFDLYQSLDVSEIKINDNLRRMVPGFPDSPPFKEFAESMPRFRLALLTAFSLYDKILLCHSEKNSKELEKFSKDFIGVYYWAHAVIARDWFRYANYDPGLQSRLDYNYDFLIYNRAWSGTREYRLKFSELLVKQQLQSNCLTSFSPVDNTHYTNHTFTNPSLATTTTNFEDLLPANTYKPCASADYNNSDYNQCGIEVVLETLFDDTRHHLTEKTLRPIACGKPFILASTSGSLQYLRDYGFETYGEFINETYDTIADPVDRLQAIINEMHRIKCLSASQKTDLWNKLNQIAQRNKKLFFSDAWHQKIINEYISNRDQALDECKKYFKGTWRTESRKILDSIGAVPPSDLTEQIRQVLSEQDSV
jgi:hypothetical protein